MEENFIGPWVDDLHQKKEYLLMVADQSISNVKNNCLRGVVLENSEPVRPPSKLPVYMIGTGVLLFALGLYIRKEDHLWMTASLLSGGAILSAGGFVLKKKQGKNNTNSLKEEIFNHDIEYDIYTNISAMNKTISDSWYEFLGDQNDKLSSQILTLPLESKIKTDMVDLSVQRSILSVSMIDFSSQLKDVAIKENLKLLEHFIDSFGAFYKKTIIETVNKQLDIYNQIELLYVNK